MTSILELYKQAPPARAIILGKGPSLDRWIADLRRFPRITTKGSGTIFACNETPFAGMRDETPYGGLFDCFWVTGEQVFKDYPTPHMRCVPIRRWPCKVDPSGFVWTPNGFLTDVAQRSVGAVAVWILGEWLKRHKAACRLVLIGFDAIDWRIVGNSALGYAKCIPVGRLINPTGNKPGATKPWTYGRASQSVQDAVAYYDERFSSVEWYHRCF
jgi:hypothetical protein